MPVSFFAQMNTTPHLFSDRELLDILSLSPNATAIYTTPQLIIQTANDAMLGFWGKDKSIIGLPIAEGVPELKGQPFIGILENVWRTGETYEATDTPAQLLANGKLQQFYFDFTYQAIKNADGKVYCILHTAKDVTEENLNRIALAESQDKEQQLYEELAATNEELSVSNEELLQSQQQLQEFNSQLEDTIRQRTKALTESEARFRGVFEQSPLALSVLTGRDMVIESANHLILKIWGKTTEVLGIPLAVALPELEGQPFLQILDDVYTSGNSFYAYETKAVQLHNGKKVDVYVDFVYSPLADETGEINSILVSAVDVTEKALSRHREQQLNEELTAANEELTSINEELLSSREYLQVLNAELEDRVARRTKSLAESEAGFRNLIMQAPVAISVLTGRELVIQTANSGILELWGKDDGVMGQPLAAALPELTGQPFLKILDDVYNSGKPFYGSGAKAYIEREGKLQEHYFNFVYHPLRDALGSVASIMVVANEVTEQINSRKRIETSEYRLRRMISAAPIGMTVLRGRELKIEIVNKNMLSIWNREESQVSGQELLKVFPELISQPFPAMLEEVFDTGLPLGLDGVAVDLAAPGGGMARHYVNFSYDPLFDVNGNVEAILATVINITEQVESRSELLRLQERGRLAVRAAELGTFDVDFKNGTLEWDERFRKLFGIYHTNPVSFEKDFMEGLHPDDRERVKKVIDGAKNRYLNNGEYDVEYRTIGIEDGLLRWVRAKGKVFFDENDEPERFIGALLDITSQKEDEQRKNDFIAMVSHELKTPLTSLKAYVQVLLAKANNVEDSFTANALDKVNKQVKKMTAMINGFLNVSSLEAGKIHLEVNEFDLNALISDTVEEVNVATQGYNISYTAGQPLNVRADYDKIGQVINNLLSNAAKYSPKGKKIEINCTVIHSMVQVGISDEGIGISKQDQEKLFNRFYRVNNTDTKTISGFGIGLYLCAEIIRRHNGHIWVESEPGKGSKFFFSLPLK